MNTRRGFLASAAVAPLLAAMAPGTQAGTPSGESAARVTRARAFALSSVRLLPGPFEAARVLDARPGSRSRRYRILDPFIWFWHRFVLPHLSELLDGRTSDVWRMRVRPELDDYAGYGEMNDRFHRLVVEGCGNAAVKRIMDMLDSQPFAAPSAMLPMQSSMQEGQQWMQQAHRTHHAMVQAIEKGQGYRAQALGDEHVEIARMNLDYALERPELAAELMPGMKLVAARR